MSDDGLDYGAHRSPTALATVDPGMSKPAPSPVDVAQDIIRPTEEVKVAIDAGTAVRTEADSDTWTVSDNEPPVRRRKILAVISHFYASGKHEQGW